jgi:predicted RecA/RadA family phage recombinase
MSMKNALFAGENITVTTPEAVTSGRLLQVGKILGVAQFDAAISTEVVLVRRGVFELTKATGAAWTLGAALYWDNTAKNVTTTVGSNSLIGAAFAPALAGDVVGQVLLDGTIRP